MRSPALEPPLQPIGCSCTWRRKRRHWRSFEADRCCSTDTGRPSTKNRSVRLCTRPRCTTRIGLAARRSPKSGSREAERPRRRSGRKSRAASVCPSPPSTFEARPACPIAPRRRPTCSTRWLRLSGFSFARGRRDATAALAIRRVVRRAEALRLRLPACSRRRRASARRTVLRPEADVLRGNLSTRPFYNERLATLAIAAVAVLAALLTLYNATELLRLSAARRATQAVIDHDQSEAARIRTQAGAAQQNVDRALLAKLAGSTREANDIIDQRTFSWTAFFRLIEKTMPTDARLITVSPRVEKGTFKVGVDIVARTVGDVASFVENLGATGSFYDVAAINEQVNDEGTLTATIEASYLSPTTAQKGTAVPAAATGKKP